NRTFTLVGHGHLWLSEHPERPGSIGWDAALPRMATWVKLQFRRNPYLHVTVFNTHFDHVGERARVESAELLRRWVETLGGTPVIVMGDFNLPPGSPGYRALTEDRGNLAELRDAYAW